MQANTPPPDMTKEQARELKQLSARLNQLDRHIKRDITRDSRRLNAIDREVSRHHAKLLKELGAKQKAFAKPLRQEARLMRTAVHRHHAGTSATQREMAVIKKRIAVLEGRLGS